MSISKVRWAVKMSLVESAGDNVWIDDLKIELWQTNDFTNGLFRRVVLNPQS